MQCSGPFTSFTSTFLHRGGRIFLLFLYFQKRLGSCLRLCCEEKRGSVLQGSIGAPLRDYAVFAEDVGAKGAVFVHTSSAANKKRCSLRERRLEDGETEARPHHCTEYGNPVTGARSQCQPRSFVFLARRSFKHASQSSTFLSITNYYKNPRSFLTCSTALTPKTFSAAIRCLTGGRRRTAQMRFTVASDAF